MKTESQILALEDTRNREVAGGLVMDRENSSGAFYFEKMVTGKGH